MKFVKTINGDYINAAQVENFHVNAKSVYATAPDGTRYRLAEDFDSHEEAQQWLDELIDELERDGD